MGLGETIKSNHKSSNESEANNSLENFLNQPNVIAAKAELENVISQNGDANQIKKIIYSLLTKRSWLHNELQKRGSDDLMWMMEEFKPHREWYKGTLEQLEKYFKQNGINTDSNPGWFSMTATKRQPGVNSQLSYKVYETLDIKDYSKISELPKLVSKLTKIGEETGEQIKIKIPANFNGFITHNDSIVVHCDRAETCAKVQQAISNWCQENNVSIAERELNRATVALDGKTEANNEEEGSFSELVAAQISTWIDEHKSNYSPEVMASEAIKHTILLAQKAPTPPQKD